MGGSDNAKHESESVKGEPKEPAGKSANGQSVKGEGKVDQAKAEAKKAINDIKDSLDKSGPHAVHS